MSPRRCYIVGVRPEEIVELFRIWNLHSGFVALPRMDAGIDTDGNRVEIPADMEVLDANYDWNSRLIYMKISHPSFPLNPDGCEYPRLYLKGVTIEGRKVEQADHDSPIIMEVKCGPQDVCLP